MGQLYCFSCGKALNDAEQEKAAGAGPVPMCDSCKSAGPQIDPGDVRWMVRRSEERPQGPLSRDAVVDRLARDLLGPYDQVCRVNSEWQRMVEHADFRACFIPGTPERNELEKLRKTIQGEKSAETNRQRLRILRAAALLAVGIVLPVVTTTTGFGVLPESWVSAIEGMLGGVWGEAQGVIKSASNQEQARQAVKTSAGLPAQNAVARLKDAYPKVEEPLELLITRGEAELWRGTLVGFQQARDDFEKAVAVAPEDPQAVAGLAIAYAALLAPERGQIVTVVDLAQRAEALAPGSASALKAGAVAAFAGGDVRRAAELAERCVALHGTGAALTPDSTNTPAAAAPPDAAAPAAPAAAPPDAAAPPAAQPAGAAKVDPGCAALKAAATLDVAAAEGLDQRYPNIMPVQVVRLHIAASNKSWAEVLKVGRALGKRAADDPTPWAYVAQAASAMGLWKEAADAAGKVAKSGPWRLDLRLLQAEILLKVNRRYSEAMDLYTGVFKDERWSEYADKVGAYTDAANAALGAGNTEQAMTWTEAALKEDKGWAGAVLVRARAMEASGKASEVEALLATIDNAKLSGRDGARYLVGVGRMHLDAGRSRPATQALDLALELDPAYTPAHLERARAYLKGGNPGAAIQQLERLALTDASLDGARSALTDVWMPPAKWDDLRRDLESQATADVRLAPDAPAAVGVVAWASGAGDASRVLQHALETNPNATAAYAAMAWLLIDRGEPGSALKYIEKVLGDQPQSGLFHALRGRALAMQGRFGEAERAFTQAMVNAAKEPSVYRWRAEERRRAGDLAGARADLREALKLAPDDLASAVLLVDLQGETK